VGLTAAQADAIRAQMERHRSWKHAEGPNPIVGEFVGESTGSTKFHDDVPIKVIVDEAGEEWAVWLLGQLAVQWTELERMPQRGDILSFWVSPVEKVSAGGNKYRPSKILCVPADASPPSAPAPSGSAEPGPGQAATGSAAPESGGGEAAPWYQPRLEALGQWPPSDALALWLKTHDAAQIEAALLSR